MRSRRTVLAAWPLWVACAGTPKTTTGDDPTGPTGPTEPTPPTVTDTDPPPDTDTDSDTDSDTDTVAATGDTGNGGTTLPPGLNGTPPATALPLPTFSDVVAMDGTARTNIDLVGQPTVLWFYPAAFTGG